MVYFCERLWEKKLIGRIYFFCRYNSRILYIIRYCNIAGLVHVVISQSFDHVDINQTLYMYYVFAVETLYIPKWCGVKEKDISFM